ncbi:MAG: hypothetical protein ACF8MJ_10440 [Phycisphaerales bacterium JB050]
MLEPESLVQFTSLGSAGLIAAIWFMERRHSELRDKQLTESHQRILEQRTHVDALMEVVRENTRAITALESGQRVIVESIARLPRGDHSQSQPPSAA